MDADPGPLVIYWPVAGLEERNSRRFGLETVAPKVFVCGVLVGLNRAVEAFAPDGDFYHGLVMFVLMTRG